MPLFFAFITGTYGWQNEQNARNDFYGTKDIIVPVELVKLERVMGESETEMEIPIAGTVFYLYRESGVQIGGQYITGEDGKISLQLPIGKYYFEEAFPSIGYTFDTDINGETIRKYPFAVTGEEEGIIVKAYNKRLKGDLLIRKIVENTDGSPLNAVQQNMAFEFTVNFYDGGSYSYAIDDGEPKTLVSGETLTLRSGQTAVFKDIPVGILYDVVETPVKGYTTSSTGHRGNIIAGEQSVAEFINRCDAETMGSIIVSKEIKGENIDINKEFGFEIVIGGVVESFTLKHGEIMFFSGLPVGTEYIVTEDNADTEDYTALVESYEGQIISAETIILPFTNIYNEITPYDKTGSLTVSKIVIGENIDPNKDFGFMVMFGGENAPEDYTFTIKAGEKYTIENLPHGISYTVSETDAADYEAALSTINGVIVGEQTAELLFVNKTPEVQDETVILKIKKVLAGELLEYDKNRQFDFTLTVDGIDTAFILKADEEKEFIMPYGAVYEVKEDNYIKDGFSQSVINGSGTAVNELTEAVVTNTYVGEPHIEIIGEKKWDNNGYKDVTLPKSITIRLKNGDAVIEEKTVSPDIDNRWKYSFIVPKYNSDGTEAVYTLEEDSVPNFRTTYDGYNITNTYVKPIEVDPPIITKVVKGENAPSAKFEFVFMGQHGTPMPEGSVGYKKILSITDAGELEIGIIKYEEAGTYVYNVYESNTGEAGWKYDTALYTITVVVTETDHVLNAERTIEKNGVAAGSIVFTNAFDPIKDETIIISGQKTWDHGNNPEADRPTSIIVELYADGELAAQRRVTAEDNWKYSFEGPRFDADGKEIVYTINEAEIKDYTKEIKGYNLINTYSGTPKVPGDLDDPPTGGDINFGLWLTMTLMSFVGMIFTKGGKKRKVYIPKCFKN